ncbi:hypothetical protein Ddc_09179 [Ditylenchus destructor]|nr:hypothetical protein Ddc_09179 [Ditylenchus destructor]
MGSSLCKPRPKKRITTSSWVANDNVNPFESSFTKKERVCLRETYQRLSDPKEIIGQIFVDIVCDLCPEFKKVFGVDRAPKVQFMKMPKLGGHVSRMTDFFEQITSMIGFTENLIGAWQLVRKTGRLHAKVAFLESNQNQLEKNYFSIVIDTFIEQFIPHVAGTQKDHHSTNPGGGATETNGTTAESEAEKKKVRFAQHYTPVFIADVWRRFFGVLNAQLTESFEFERQKCLDANNQQTLAPHQRAEEVERKKRQNAERQSEIENSIVVPSEKQKMEQMFEDPF